MFDNSQFENFGSRWQFVEEYDFGEGAMFLESNFCFLGSMRPLWAHRLWVCEGAFVLENRKRLSQSCQTPFVRINLIWQSPEFDNSPYKKVETWQAPVRRIIEDRCWRVFLEQKTSKPYWVLAGLEHAT